MPLKRWLALLVAASLGASGLMGADAPQEPAKGSVLMRKKLEYTQKVLEGLALEDFDMIVKNARILRTFGGLEQWSRADSEAYRAQLKIFRFAKDRKSTRLNSSHNA